MTTRSARTMLKLLAVMALGCGSSIEGPTGSGGASEASGGSGGTTESSGSQVTGGSSGSTTTSTGEGGGSCEGFTDQTSVGSVTVHFINQTGVPLYLPGMCGAVKYTLAPVNNEGGVSYVYDSSCLQTCNDLKTQQPYACGACAPSAYLIPANGTLDVVWGGTGLESSVAMPTQCWAYPPPPGITCSEIVAAPADSYGVTATAYDGCEGPCSCDAQGYCGGTATGAQAISEPATFVFPNDKDVDVIFGSCSFPCATD